MLKDIKEIVEDVTKIDITEKKKRLKQCDGPMLILLLC